MRAPTLHSLLLALVLVLGQWVSFAHAGKHSALSPVADQSCEFCLHAQGLGMGVVELDKPAVTGFAHEVPAVASPSLVTLAAPSYYSARGPPAFLA